MSQQSGKLSVGTIVGGDYHVQSTLAEGESGTVYAVQQLSTGIQRALKVFRSELFVEDNEWQELERATGACSRIESDHIVQVLASGRDPATGRTYVSMELLVGQTLLERVREGGRLDASLASLLLEQVVHALSAAHAAGIVHGQLGPQDIFLARHRRAAEPLVKILDLGFAKVVAETRTNAAWTPWTAPQAADGAVTPAADIWSIGLLTFFMLTGKPYWRSCQDDDDLDAAHWREILLEPLPAASSRARELGCDTALPGGFDAWFSRCVSLDPAARFPTAKAAGDAWATSRLSGSPPGLARFSTDDPIEAELIAALRAAPADEGGRKRYARWLEERGQSGKAAFLRLEAVGASDGQLVAPLQASRIDAGWRAITSRPPIGRCLKFAFACPKRWDELTPTSEDTVRHCSACERPVYFCSSVEEAGERGARNECVAVDAAITQNEALGAYDLAAGVHDDGILMGAPLRPEPLHDSAVALMRVGGPPPARAAGLLSRLVAWFRAGRS